MDDFNCRFGGSEACIKATCKIVHLPINIIENVNNNLYILVCYLYICEIITVFLHLFSIYPALFALLYLSLAYMEERES